MKLLREYIDPSNIEHYLEEDKKTGEKNVFLKGLFTEADTKNRNGRVYPEKILDREIFKMQERIARKDFPIGACDHPPTPEMKLEDSAIIIQSLQKNGKKYFGEAKILKNTPKGSILYNLCKESIKLGISSRALGSLQEKDGSQIVEDDLNLISFDCVADPSVADAILSAVFENAEYYIEEGKIKENIIISYKNQLKSLKKNELKDGIVKLYNKFLEEI